jgi:hypothetical protein
MPFYRKNPAWVLRLVMACLILTQFTPQEAWARSQEENEEVALEITKIFRGARGVISKYQKLINDPNKGDKGLSPDKVIEEAKQNYKNATGRPFTLEAGTTLKGLAQLAMLNAIREVMNNAQPLLNERGRGFKGFLPAVFARLVADSFNRLMKGRAYIKLTAPRNYIRNRSNRPDKWEHNVIENMFRRADYEKDKPFYEEARHRGKSAFRLIIPEYYKKTCLGCHGEPRGERDITGGKKEGGKLGELGGAISFAIYN